MESHVQILSLLKQYSLAMYLCLLITEYENIRAFENLMEARCF